MGIMGVTFSKVWEVLLTMQQYAWTGLKWLLMGMGALTVLCILLGVAVGKYFSRPGISNPEEDK
jgi:hypothetical protein